MTGRRWVLASVASAGLLLAACSSGHPTAKHVTTTTRRATTTSSSSTTSTTTARSTTSTTTGSVACNQVSASAGQAQGAAGTITGVVNVTNTGSTACTVNGYPTLALLSGSGAPLTVTMVDGLSVSVSPPAANAAPSAVNLAPSGAAQFTYQYSDVPVGTETSCPSSEAARVTLSGATAPSPTFPLAIDPCNNGTVRVSPLYSAG